MSAAPLFPYITLPELTLVPAHTFGAFPPSPISIKPFGALVATGVYLASFLTVKRARQRSFTTGWRGADCQLAAPAGRKRIRPASAS